MPGDADEDGDDIAFDEGMEPESATGDLSPAGGGDDDDAYDDGDGDDAVAAGGPVARTVDTPRGTRKVSDKVRGLMAEMAKKFKEAGGLESDEEPLDHEDAPMEPPTPTADTPRKPADPAAPPATPPPAQQPPAPSLDPEVVRLRQEIEDRRAELEAREKDIEERSRKSDIGKLRDLYFEKGAPAIAEIVKQWSGVADDSALKDEIADLITDLSIHIGIDVPQSVRENLENRRTRKGVKVWKAEQERIAREAAEKAELAKEQENRVKVMAVLQQEITKAEHAETYPWLSAEPNAGEIILDVVEASKAKDGTKLTWQEAAKRANDYLQTQSLSWFDKRKHLLNTAPSQGAPPSGQKQQSSQGNRQVNRSQTPPPKPPPAPPPTPLKNGKWDPEAHRKAVKARHRNAFTRTDEE